MSDHPRELGARVERVRALARGHAGLSLLWAAWAALALLQAPSAAGTIRVTVPPDTTGTLSLGTLGEDGRLTVLTECRAAVGEPTEVATPTEDPGATTWALRYRTDGGQLARLLFPDTTLESLPPACEIDSPTLFEPGKVRVLARDAARASAKVIVLLVTESDGRTYARALQARAGSAEVTLEDIRPGLLVVHAVSDGLADASHSIQIRPGESTNMTLLLSRNGQAAVSIAPFLSAGGDLQEGLHTAATLAVFVLVVGMWMLIATCYSPVWTYFGLRDRRARIVLSLTAALTGVVLLGNGVSLIVLDAIRFVPLVSAVCALQLAFLVLALLGYLSRKAWVRTLAGLGVVFSLLVTFVFLPSFVFEGEDAGIGQWLTIAQIALVCSMALAVTWLAFTGSRTRRATASGACPICGAQIDRLSGRCECPPEAVGRSGKRTARLTILHADGRSADIIIGPHTSVGRAQTCDIALPSDPQVGEIQATIELEDGDLLLRESAASTGTYVNGERVTLRRLHDGDEILMGDTWFVVELL